MHIFLTVMQHSNGSPSQRIQGGQRNREHKSKKRISDIVVDNRLYDFVCRKSERLSKEN